MINDNRKNTAEYLAVAEAMNGVLDSSFLKALTDPARVLIIKRLTLLGASDVSTIAKGLSQDRSVISRHLATLERAGIAVSRKVGRRVLYDLDGPHNVEKVSAILDAIRPMAELCKPFQDLDNCQNGEAA